MEKILAVDDNETNLMILEEILGDEYDLHTARSGQECIREAARINPALVLLDIMMPEMNGYETCRKLAADLGLRAPRVIMVSAKSLASERIEAYEAGAHDYVTKPFEESELLAKVRIHLQLRSMQEVDRLKSDILTLIGHESRTPLCSIMSAAELLRDQDEISDSERKDLATIVCGGAKAVHRMFERVLMYSSLKAGRWWFSFGRVSLAEVVEAGIDHVREMAEANDVQLESRVDFEGEVRADRRMLALVLASLLDNAIKHSPASSTVRILGSAVEDGVEVSVSDQGSGIDAEFMPRLFDEFLVQDLEHHSKGNGLSLAIAKRVVEGHGGELTASCPEEGGARFLVRLPMRVASQVS